MNNAQLVIDEVKKAVKGKDDCIIKAFAAFLAGGHILLEDVPGVGKTTLAVAFSRAMALVNHRVQFTPDVLPADILGFSMYQKQTGEFVYREGAVICFWQMRLTGQVPKHSLRFWRLWRKEMSLWME